MTLLATHVGSLPRSQDVVDFLFAREKGEPFDPAAFDACMTAAVDENVRRQKAAGVDIVSDGEASKIGTRKLASIIEHETEPDGKTWGHHAPPGIKG